MKLQWMHAREKELGQQGDELFNKLRPMAPRQQWKSKALFEALTGTMIEVAGEQGATDVKVLVEIEVNWSDQPATPVRPVIKASA
jgi:hypothetical protein